MPSDPNGVGAPTPSPGGGRRVLEAYQCGGVGDQPCSDYLNNFGCKSSNEDTLVLDADVCVSCGSENENVCTHHYGPNNGCAEGYGPLKNDGKCYKKPTQAPTKAPTIPPEDEYFLPTDEAAHAELVAQQGDGTGEYFSDPMCQLVCPCSLLPKEAEPEETLHETPEEGS